MPAAVPRSRSPVAERIRARIEELGLSESDASKALGSTRTVLSTLLRRLDAGHSLSLDTLDKLERVLGKSRQWILTGDEPAGVRLADCAGWGEAAKTARERYGLTDEQIAKVAACRFPVAPRLVDALLVRAISDAL